MKTEKIVASNIKCDGCVSTIKTKILELEGVESVDVNREENSVTINHSGKLTREDFTTKLLTIGYPEK